MINDVEGLTSANDNYFNCTTLGQGAYGIVYQCQDKTNNNQFVALKDIKLEMEQEGIPSTSLREICILKELDHENIVKLLDVIYEKNKLCLVFELMSQDLNYFIII